MLKKNLEQLLKNQILIDLADDTLRIFVCCFTQFTNDIRLSALVNNAIQRNSH